MQLHISTQLYSSRSVGHWLCHSREDHLTDYTTEQVTLSGTHRWRSGAIVSVDVVRCDVTVCIYQYPVCVCYFTIMLDCPSVRLCLLVCLSGVCNLGREMFALFVSLSMICLLAPFLLFFFRRLFLNATVSVCVCVGVRVWVCGYGVNSYALH